MLKIVLVIAVIAAVYFFFIKKSAPLTKARREGRDAKDNDTTMLECETCGTYITAEDAVVSAGKFYCSTECRDKA